MSYLQAIERHFQHLLAAAADGMWPSVLDTRTRRPPEGDHVPRRVYRLIGAPRGSTLYWDQPMVVAAMALAELTAQPQYSQAADRYVAAFLARCVSATGIFRWGNHAYYDLVADQVVEFHGGPHELRPITPAWDIFWRHDPAQLTAYLRLVGQRHVYDSASGGFNRHDDGKKGHAFIEAGGILSESLAWLYGRTADEGLLRAALNIARYSFRHRNPATGLMPNEPDMGRWDALVCTSEIGLWAQCLLRAAGYTATDEFAEMACKVTRSYLDHAYDANTGKYFGQIAVRDGRPVMPTEAGYWPRAYADPWSVDQWPTHDYPMAVAEACLTLHALTGDDAFLDGVRRWARIACESSPGRTGRWAYAESYGRCIHFLTRAGLQLASAPFIADARQLAAEAVERLRDGDLFQGYPDSHLYESVDGVGFLFLALIFLETRREPELHGFGF